MVACIFITACNKDIIESNTTRQPIPAKTTSIDGRILLTRQIEDPYKYENMVTAFNQLRHAGVSFPFQSLPISGNYVKVLVTSDSLECLLEADTTNIWFDFPLDYELSEEGCFYSDPNLSDSVKMKYGVVPTNYTAPAGMICHLIYPVLIPDELRNVPTALQPYYDLIETRSIELCDRWNSRGEDDADDTDETIDTSMSRTSYWYPEANIRAWDDVVGGFVNLQGVRVVAKRGTSTKNYAITDAQGHCSMKKVKSNKDITYIVRWERNNWKMRNANRGDLVYIGPTGRGIIWNWDISSNSRYNVNVASIHRAALKAFYGNFCGLERPKAFGKLIIEYIDSYNQHEYGHTVCTWNMCGLISNIKIYGSDPNTQSYRNTDELIGTVFHEFGHQSMLQFEGGTYTYFQHNNFILESWASCVAWSITNHYYRNDLGCLNYYYSNDKQGWKRPANNNSTEASPYTPVFIDLIDDKNQNDTNTLYCIDHVKDYTISELQNTILGTSFGLYSLRNTLHAHLFHGTTVSNINELCNNYSSLGF